MDGMLQDHKKLLYPNCEDGNTKLGTTLELLKWKAQNGVTDKAFESLLKIMKPKLPNETVFLGQVFLYSWREPLSHLF